MKQLNTLDLYYVNQCYKRWSEEKIVQPPIDPTRDLIKKIFLMKTIGRNTGWTFGGIASAWDELFWQGKTVTKQAMRESVQGILSARALYKRINKGQKIEAHSTKNLITSLETGIVISSSGDFLLSYPDRYETWIYLQSTPKKIRRSPLPALEHYLLHQKIREAYQKPLYLVIYYASTKRKRTIHFRVRDDRTQEECRKIVYNLTDKIKRNISYPSIGEHCKECNIKC